MVDKLIFKNALVAHFVIHLRTPLYRNAYALMLGSAITSGLGVIYWWLAARHYTAYQVGLNAAAISAIMFLSGLAQLNLTDALTQFIPILGRAATRFIGYSYLTSLVVALVVSVLFIGGLNLWLPTSDLVKTSPPFQLGLIVATMVWGIFALQDSALTGLRQTIWVPIENTIFSVLKIALLVSFATSFPQYGIFASWTIPAAVLTLPVNRLIFRTFIPKHAATAKSQTVPIGPSQIIKFAAANYLGYLFDLMSTTLLPILVVSYAGASTNAHFYVAWTIANSLQLVALNMGTSLAVEGAADEKNLTLYGRHTLIQMMRWLGPLSLMTLIGAPYILRIFGTTYAAKGVTLLRLLAVAVIPYSINTLYLSFARVQRRISGIIFVQATLCVLVLMLGYALLPSDGIAGIGIAWLVSQTLVAVVIMLTQLRPILRPIISTNVVREL